MSKTSKKEEFKKGGQIQRGSWTMVHDILNIKDSKKRKERGEEKQRRKGVG